MKRKCWFYLCIIQTVLLLGAVCLAIWPSLTAEKLQKTDLTEYVVQFSEENNYLPDAGYIPDTETAKAVGSVVIDKLTGNSLFGTITVKYDEDNRLWKISKSYLFRQGGFVIIEQDSGKIVKALLTK